MNRIYKVIWSKARNCYVAASEIAKSHSKSKTSGGMKKVLLALAAAATLSCVGFVGVEAEDSTEATYEKLTVTDTLILANGDKSATLKYDATNERTELTGGLNVTSTTTTSNLKVDGGITTGGSMSIGTKDGSLTVGGKTTTKSLEVSGGSAFKGMATFTNGITLSENIGLDANNNKIINAADGDIKSGSKDAVNGGQLFSE